MDDQIINLAQLHYIAEQQARHSCIWRGHENCESSVIVCYSLGDILTLSVLAHQYPNFKELWAYVTPRLRQEDIERVELLASSPTTAEAEADYEGNLKILYEKCFASMTQLEAEKASSVPSEYHMCLANVQR